VGIDDLVVQPAVPAHEGDHVGVVGRPHALGAHVHGPGLRLATEMLVASRNPMAYAYRHADRG
jgi:hypothetical protein